MLYTKLMKLYTKIIAFIKRFEEKHANATLFVGIAIGIGVGMYLYACLVPGSMYGERRHHMAAKCEYAGTKCGYMMMETGHTMSGGMTMGEVEITNERQFLEEMIMHHESALRMSHQILSRSGISERISALAQSIIVSQTAEIEAMESWLKK